jgi:hypothetical protein
MPDASQFRNVDTQSNEIRSITTHRVADNDPDLSYLGEYSDSPGEHAIEVFGPEPGDTAACAECGEPITFVVSAWGHDTGSEVADIATDQDHDAEPDADFEPRSYQAGKYRYFNPANPEYARADFERMERYNNDGWGMVGVYAQANITVAGIIQTVQSGGLWGIESDSDESYFTEIGKEELSQLVTVLEELGFERTAIDEACADVTNASD